MGLLLLYSNDAPQAQHVIRDALTELISYAELDEGSHKLIYSVLVVDNLAIKIRLRDSAIRAGEDRVTIHFAIVTHATKIEMTM